jgi:hypothetical protein
VERVHGEGSRFIFELDFKYNPAHRENSSIKKDWSRDLSMVNFSSHRQAHVSTCFPKDVGEMGANLGYGK